MRSTLALHLVLVAACACAFAQETATAPRGSAPATATPPGITLERIMSDPVWIGRSPEDAFWSDDGASVWYERIRPERDGREWVRIDLEGNELEVATQELARARRPGGVLDASGARRLEERDGDLYLVDRASGAERRLTRTAARETDPMFLAGESRIAFEREGAIVVRDLAGGDELEPAVLVLEDAPAEDDAGDDATATEEERGEEGSAQDTEEESEDADSGGFLAEQQERLFETLRARREREEREEEREGEARRAREAAAAPRYYLGSGYARHDAHLAPTGDSVLVELGRAGEDGRGDLMPRYVTASGYVETEEVRAKVGTGTRADDALALVDLAAGEVVPLDLGALPGRTDDPLARLRAGAAAWSAALASGEPLPTAEADPGDAPPVAREISVTRAQWEPDGERALVELRSHDRKSDWIVLVDARARAVTVIDTLHDEAWINGRLRSFGWLGRTGKAWILSEATGWSHLYLHDPASGETRALTSGEWEASDARPTRDGAWIYFLANVRHPGEHELWRVRCADGAIEQITALGGRNQFWLSPDETRVLVLHSGLNEPPELHVQDATPLADARRLTRTVSEEFRAHAWVEPAVVAVPSRHGRAVHARLYLPPDVDGGAGRGRPAVLFVHGAGYLQNAHLGWSTYFREHMFHSLLVRAGCVVLDMDYRASAGYGRDWRTAIYRNMGAPELDDLEDGVAWLVREHGVDPARVGVYGGSYGGFLTLMALFTRPELFACGAALRPVTDWAHYSDGYTANILNTPDVDPEAYWRSSPIEHAAGLARPLLICHGMLDDNVFFQDSVRLAQRLIELEKEGWELAAYPIEPHSFREPASWLDEYRRILALFERHLGLPAGDAR